MISLNLKSRLIALPLLIAFMLLFFYAMLFMQLSAFQSFLGFNVSLFGAFVAQRFLKNSIKAKTIKRLFFWASVIFLITLLVRPAYAASILEYSVPTSASGPAGIAIGPGGNIIFTEFSKDKIGILTIATGKIKEWALTSGRRPYDIAFNNTHICFTERYSNNKIGVLDATSNNLVEYQLTEYTYADLWGIIADPEGGIWFASRGNNFIGNLSKKELHTYNIPTPNSGPQHLVYDPRGPFIWFTMNIANKIGRLNPSAYSGQGEIVEYSLPAPLSEPDHIAIDSFGFIWFTSRGSNAIGKLNPWSGEFTTIYTSGIARGIAIDSDNNVWFVLDALGKIARYSPSLNLVTEYSIPTSPSSPEEILVKESSPITVWFTEYSGNKIGKLIPGEPFTTSTVSELPTASSTTATSATATSSNLYYTNNTAVAAAATAPAEVAASTYSTEFSELAYYLKVTTTDTNTITTTKTSTTTTTTTATSTTYAATENATTTATTTVYSPTVTTTTTTTTTATATSTTYATTTTATSTSTSWSTVTSTTSTTTTATSTSTTTTTTTATTTTTPSMPAPIIPGFPIESIIAGLASGALALSVLRRIKKR